MTIQAFIMSNFYYTMATILYMVWQKNVHNQHGGREEEAWPSRQAAQEARMSFRHADPPWHVEVDCHWAKTGKTLALERFWGQIFNCHPKGGNWRGGNGKEGKYLNIPLLARVHLHEFVWLPSACSQDKEGWRLKKKTRKDGDWLGVYMLSSLHNLPTHSRCTTPARLGRKEGWWLVRQSVCTSPLSVRTTYLLTQSRCTTTARLGTNAGSNWCCAG
jgi:hypothetical protein